MNKRPCVLIVEKNPRVRDFLARELAREEFYALLARDRDHAAQLVRSNGRPDALVCDADSLFGQSQRWADALCPGTPVVALVYPASGSEEDPICAAALVEKTGDLRPLAQALLGVLNLDQPGSGEKS